MGGSGRKLWAAALPIAVLSLAIGGCGGGDSETSATASEGTPEAERYALAQTDTVQGAPDRDLILSRVVIPPGAVLDLHRHRGTQVARIDSGTLSYTVEDGEVVVRRGPSDGESTVVRKIEAGQTGALSAGEWIVEQPSDIHRATNESDEAVVVHLATLLEAGAPAATPVER